MKKKEKLVTCICSTPLSSKAIKSCGFNLTIEVIPPAYICTEQHIRLTGILVTQGALSIFWKNNWVDKSIQNLRCPRFPTFFRKNKYINNILVSTSINIYICFLLQSQIPQPIVRGAASYAHQNGQHATQRGESRSIGASNEECSAWRHCRHQSRGTAFAMVPHPVRGIGQCPYSLCRQPPISEADNRPRCRQPCPWQYCRPTDHRSSPTQHCRTLKSRRLLLLALASVVVAIGLCWLP
jgi:hypothetical protein